MFRINLQRKIMRYQLSNIEDESLALFVDSDEQPIESKIEYVDRFQNKYPNLPDEVISQWFYDQRLSIHENSWLPYGLLKFSLVELTSLEVSMPCFSENQTIDQYRIHFENENSSPRMCRLSEYISENLTWPVPPIVLENIDADIITPWGMECDSPFHLLEGHHRFAVLLAYKSKIELKPTHKVWVAKIS